MKVIGKMGATAGAVLLVMTAGCGESSRANGEAGAAGGSGSGSGGGGGNGAVSGSGGGSGRAGASGGSGLGGGGAASGGASGSGGSGGSGAGSSEYFISAVVEGVPVRAEMNVQVLWFRGLSEAQLGLEGSTADRRFDFVIADYATSNACFYLVVTPLPLAQAQGQGAGSFVEGGSCEVTVTADAPNVGDILEGTFSAVVGKFGAAPLVTLTDGRFRAPRVASPDSP